MRQKVVHAEAPSICAASINSSEMPKSPARNITVGMPTHCQAEVSEITYKARCSSPSQGSAQALKPIFSKIIFTAPHCGFRINVHRKPVTSTDKVAGAKIMVRKRSRPLNLDDSRTAKNNPRLFCKKMWIPKKMKVCNTAPKKRSRHSGFVKRSM